MSTPQGLRPVPASATYQPASSTYQEFFSSNVPAVSRSRIIAAMLGEPTDISDLVEPDPSTPDSNKLPARPSAVTTMSSTDPYSARASIASCLRQTEGSL